MIQIKVKNQSKKISFLWTVGFLLDVSEKFLNSSESNIFPIKTLDKIQTLEPKPDPTHESIAFNAPRAAATKKSEQKISPLKLCENYINNEIFREYFTYQIPLFLIKALHKANKAKNEKKQTNQVHDKLTDLRSTVNKKRISGNKNLEKAIISKW